MKNHELLLTVDKPPVDLTVRYSLFKGDEPMNYPYNGRNRNVLSDQTIKANDVNTIYINKFYIHFYKLS